MKTYKGKDLYIVRPIKLIEQEQKLRFEFPYNIYYNLGKLSDKQLAAGINCEKFTYSFHAKDISIATSNPFNNYYYDIINNKKYPSYKFYLWNEDDYQCTIDKFSKVDDLIVKENVLDVDLLSIFFARKKINSLSIWCTASRIFDTFHEETERIENKIFSLNDLREFRDMLVAEENDKILTVYHEWTKTFKEPPFCENDYSYNIKGKKIKSIDDIHVKEKILKK